jgi:hypothetical protein
MAQGLRVEVDDRRLQVAFGRLSAAKVKAARQWLRETAEEIMAASKEECPVDTGALRATGHVQRPSPDEVVIGYGGVAAPYALVQHERLDYQHTVGKAKYLEDPFRRLTANATAELAAAIRSAT